MPLGIWRSASALTSGTTSGTSGSMRQALELSMTMAPARAAMGLYSRLTAAGVLDRTMSTPANASGRIGSTGYVLALEVDRFARTALGGQELDGPEGELAFDQHLPHDFADRTGRTDYRNARNHAHCPFMQDGNKTPDLNTESPG